MRQRDEAEQESTRAVKEQQRESANDNIITGAGQAEDLSWTRRSGPCG